VNTTPLTPEAAHAAVLHALRRVVPDADLEALAEDAVLRPELEMDSLDFLSFVEEVCRATGVRVEEADYAALDTLGSSTSFLVEASRT
jgi:acyl carrier protein